MPDAAPVRVMGILNATPDSFSDGGRFLDPAAALVQARRMAAEGAQILDIGGESTRPGAPAVDAGTEIERVVPLIAALRAERPITLSVDTMKPEVARAAVAAGADIWNDVSALTWAPDSAEVAAELGCQVVLMHMLGDPRTMQTAPRYEDVVGEVEAYLLARAEAAMAAGVARDRIWLDPGIGFGKTLAHNLALLARLDRFVALGFPMLLGVSRKSFIKAIDPRAESPGDRLGGSLACALAGARAGVAAVRVHDVVETVQALAVARALQAAG
ncbi:dihydropteroate synthase [Phenylobacterium aquaticum]|uniref:dihydropteroate synthase n=1 Tax=Phenylobacterium aquaticum TaxID=1763816 RepID=UPI001F5E2364|nr:dihydropteroate synthase [Phenylobacterium aquaticum]MCI3135097.1 dihydropteroate synthase [Phenylobacterium aquaticum]